MNRKHKHVALAVALALVAFALAQGLFLYLSGRWPPVRFGLTYQFTAETVFDRIAIEGSRLEYTYFEDAQNKCERWLEQRPCWQMKDLQRKRFDLTRDQVEELIDLVETGGFMQLPERVGNPGPDQRYYSYGLSVFYGSERNTVSFERYPGGEDMPPVFDAIRTKLFEIVSRDPR